MKECQIEGCDGASIARGWCNKHYLRWLHNGDPLKVKKRFNANGGKCAVCSSKVYSNGWCVAHYGRWQRHGDPLGVPAPREQKLCSIPDCSTYVKARGWCQLHYKNWQRQGDPLLSYRDTLTCSCSKCTALRPDENFWCSKHFAMILTGKHPEEIESQSGWWINAYGYIIVSFPKVEGQTRRLSQHRLVMETYLGRELDPTETVHHKNGIRDDNRLANLELWSKAHVPGQRVKDQIEWAHAILARYEQVDQLAGAARRIGVEQ